MTELTAEERRLLDAGLKVVKTVSDRHSVYYQSPEKVNAVNVPDDVEPDIYEYLKSLPAHEVYGSVPTKGQSPVARRPADIDMVVPNPASTAHAIKHKLEAKGHRTNLTSNPQFGSFVVQVENDAGEFVDAVDIHPLEGHYGKYDTYGESLPPYEKDGLYMQRAADQVMRKANSVLGNNRKDGGWGPAEHRALKDTVDFVTTARTLVDSKKLQAEAKLKQAQEADKALKVWEQRAKKMDGYDQKLHRVGEDPIPATYEKKYKDFAAKNPHTDVRNIVVGPRGGIMEIEREVADRTNRGEKANPLYVAQHYAKDPYQKVQDPYSKPASHGYFSRPKFPGAELASDVPLRMASGLSSEYAYNFTQASSLSRKTGNALLNENGRSDFMKLGETNFFQNSGGNESRREPKHQEVYRAPRSSSRKEEPAFELPSISGGAMLQAVRYVEREVQKSSGKGSRKAPNSAVSGLGSKLSNSFTSKGGKSGIMDTNNLF